MPPARRSGSITRSIPARPRFCAARYSGAPLRSTSRAPATSRGQAMRKLVSSGSPFEPRIGFSRAVRVGQIVAVSGTAPIAADGSVACPGDVYGQTRRCLEIIADAVVDAGLSFDTVVRTRIMLTDVSQWETAARAHGEFFRNPACHHLRRG